MVSLSVGSNFISVKAGFRQSSSPMKFLQKIYIRLVLGFYFIYYFKKTWKEFKEQSVIIS